MELPQLIQTPEAFGEMPGGEPQHKERGLWAWEQKRIVHLWDVTRKNGFCSLWHHYQNFAKNLSIFPVYLRNKFLKTPNKTNTFCKREATWGPGSAGDSLPFQAALVRRQSRPQIHGQMHPPSQWPLQKRAGLVREEGAPEVTVGG